ncbi:hypothetical protein AXF13_06600 [Desulfovibrio fairfieldensis]|uniref:Uncharacterized protein n=1 Tax=Desulfovibrio fairfieldensis TaxID=44742 RepID=A0A0X8JJ99_9BACT|nr:hypothetical protein AXF13_06600 [Desulfovibrio fairfieldensis]
MPSVRQATVGVGNNEYPLPMVRGTKGGCGQHFPFRIVPERGQIPQDDLNTAGEQAPHVFNDDVTGPDFPDNPRILIPQTAPCPLLDTRAAARAADVLTWKTTAQHVHRRQICSFEAGHVIIYEGVRPVPGEDGPAERVDLAKPLMFKARPGEAQVTQTGPAEQTAYFQQALLRGRPSGGSESGRSALTMVKAPQRGAFEFHFSGLAFGQEFAAMATSDFFALVLLHGM